MHDPKTEQSSYKAQNLKRHGRIGQKTRQDSPPPHTHTPTHMHILREYIITISVEGDCAHCAEYGVENTSTSLHLHLFFFHISLIPCPFVCVGRGRRAHVTPALCSSQVAPGWPRLLQGPYSGQLCYRTVFVCYRGNHGTLNLML